MGPAAWARHPSPNTLLLRTSGSLSLTPATSTGSKRLDSRPATLRPPDALTRACRISPIVPTEKDRSATVHEDFFRARQKHVFVWYWTKLLCRLLSNSYCCQWAQTHSFAHDERQQVVEERGEAVCRNRGGQQGNSLAGELLEHGVKLRLNHQAHQQTAHGVNGQTFGNNG